MKQRSNENISKFICYILRHKPETIGVTVNEYGWADVNELIEKSANADYNFDLPTLVQIVNTCDKQRYSLDLDNMKIRCNQGHSIQVDVELKEIVPPNVLYHGTAERNVGSILREGLQKAKRLYCHLSVDTETALSVGKRYGETVLLEVKALQMHNDGYKFYISSNGVYLVDSVPVEYLKTR